MDINNPLSSMPNMPHPFSGGLGNSSSNLYDNYGVSNDFSIQLAKMQELIALQQQKQQKHNLQDDISSFAADKIESNDSDQLKEDENEETLNLLDTPEAIGFNTSIKTDLDFNYLDTVIDKFFKEFMETSFENFKRKTKSLFESLNRAVDTPFDKENTHPSKTPYNTIMHSITTELSYLHESVQFTDEELNTFDKIQFKARFDYVVMTFEPLFPELANERYSLENEDETLLSTEKESNEDLETV